MKSLNRTKLYRDHDLWRDLAFLTAAAAFVLIQAFDQSLTDALLFAPLLVAGSFGVLLLAAHTVLLVMRLLEALLEWITDSKRTPRR